MTTFNYKAAGENGQLIEGTLVARDRDSAARQLQSQGNVPIKIEAAGMADISPSSVPTKGQGTGSGSRIRRSNSATIDFFTLELATLLRAGLPIAQALDTLADLADEPQLAEMLQTINKLVRGGEPLSEALKQSNAGFDHFYCNMVRAGESSGALDAALERLAAFRAGRREMQQSLISALIYPAILLVLAVAAIAVLLSFVVPQFTQMFADAGRELPLLTRIVAGAGEFVTNWWWALILAFGGGVYWLKKDWQSPEGRARWDAWLLKAALVGPLTRNLATARFARTMSTLLENGVHLVPALEITREVVGNTVIAKGVKQTLQRVREGRGLATPLMETRTFPPMATQLIRIGETSGKLEAMLAQVADIYEREVQSTLKRLLTLAEPIIIITIALIISVIILSVVLMILESNDLAF